MSWLILAVIIIVAGIVVGYYRQQAATVPVPGTTTAAPSTVPKDWFKSPYMKWAIIGAVIIGIFYSPLGVKVAKMKWSDSEWVTVKWATCSPTWNNDRGWCTVVKDAAKGRYRVIPRYKSWELWQNDGSFISVPPHGIEIYANWREHEEFIEEFHRAGQKTGSNNYGALVVRVGNTDVVEALNASRVPREFEVAKDGTEIAVTVNLTALRNFYQYNKGGLPVEVQRLD